MHLENKENLENMFNVKLAVFIFEKRKHRIPKIIVCRFVVIKVKTWAFVFLEKFSRKHKLYHVF